MPYDPQDESFDYWIEAYKSGFSSIDIVAFNLGISQEEVKVAAGKQPSVDIELRRKLDRMGR